MPEPTRIRIPMGRPKRAAFLSHLDFNLYRFRLPIMRELLRRGWEVYALSPEGSFSGRFAAEGVRHAPYRIERSSLNPFKEAVVIAGLVRVLRQVEPDLLHSFMMKPNIYGALAAGWIGVEKSVASVTGLGSFYTGETSSKRSGLLRRGIDRLYAFAMRRVDRVIFYNNDDREELLRLGICRPEQCVVIPGSGVDTRRFSPAQKPEGGPVVVTMVARLIRDKGVEEYLSATERLKKKWGDGVLFQLAGDEDPGNPWALDSARLSSCEKKGVIRRLGFVEDIPALLHGTDIYVLPSYREGLPVSVIEAMSSGLAVVTADSVGCRETIIPEESGLRVPVRDADALAEAIGRLVADAALRRRLGQNARRRAEEVFSVDRIVAAHLEVYRSLLPQSGF